jgi:thiol-disulfide isomerase/thioredoxin
MKTFDTTHVRAWQKNLATSIPMNIYVRQKNSQDPFYRYGAAIEKDCPQIDINYTFTDALPKIQIKENLQFHSIPEGTEIQPFISALTYINEPPELTAEHAGIENLPSSNLVLFVSPHCPNCPSVIQVILPVVWFNPNIDLKIIDVGLFPEVAEQQNIMSVPTLIYNDFRWTGPVKISEIVNVIKKSPDQWDPVSLERMLSEGKAIQLAQIILDNAKFSDNFDQLIAHELLSIRLGAMVCVEYIVEENRMLAQTLCDIIWPIIPEANIQVQGDLIYLIGICGTEQEIPKLQNLETQAENDDIKESITEAIENIQEQS